MHGKGITLRLIAKIMSNCKKNNSPLEARDILFDINDIFDLD